ncbi:MAG: ribosome-associated translation inhibitor RaiA [Candidatus Latescibacteria bacterium]|jgi:putative sigma-54 modulation protein|nr:ribosome-associated translation inhibitor RaiA [Candidatus Latescibacterota bacterium]
MKTSLTARHFNMSDNVRNHAIDSMAGLEKYFNRIIGVQMVLSKEKERWGAEVIVGVPGETLTAESQDDDLLFSAIDDAMAKAQRQLEKYKSKVKHEKDRREAKQYGSEPRKRRH